MPISSLPDECFSDVLSFLDWKTLVKCLFVNRYFCKFTIPLIWRDPFGRRNSTNLSLMNTLLACLNEDEISSLIPCAINFNNQPPLFEYGKFIRRFNHNHNYVNHIIKWLGLSSYYDVEDCRIQKLSNVIYHMIMRQGSNLQEFCINKDRVWMDFFNTDLPKSSTFTTYEPGITNLRSLKVSLGTADDKCENAIELLSMVPKSCNGIVDCELNSKFLKSFVDIIKSQPLKRLSLYSEPLHIKGEIKKVIYALEFRSKTLKELTFEFVDFQDIDLSFMSKFDRLERLELINCKRYLFTKKLLHLKELTLCYNEDEEDDYDFEITGAVER